MYSKHAKCMLMENSPHPDFEVCFYNGKWEKCHKRISCSCYNNNCRLRWGGGGEGGKGEMRKGKSGVSNLH